MISSANQVIISIASEIVCALYVAENKLQKIYKNAVMQQQLFKRVDVCFHTRDTCETKSDRDDCQKGFFFDDFLTKRKFHKFHDLILDEKNLKYFKKNKIL